MTRTRMMGTFYGVAALLSWAPLAFLVGHDTSPFETPLGRAVAVFYSFGPLIAALLVQGALLRKPIVEPLGIGRDVNRFWFVAWLSPVLLLALALLFTYLLDGTAPTLTVDGIVANKRSMVPPEHMAQFEAALAQGGPPHPATLVVFALIAGLMMNSLPAFAEEVAFRGFLFRELPGNYFQRSLSIGLVTFVWALPALAMGMWFREDLALGLALGLGFHLALSLALVYLRVRTGSVIACAVFRATISSLVPVALDLSFGASEFARPMYGLSGTLALLVLVGLFLVHDRFYAKQKLVFTKTRLANV